MVTLSRHDIISIIGTMEENYKRLKTTLFYVLICTQLLCAQNSETDRLVAKYPDKYACNLLIKHHYDILWNNGEITVNKSTTEERIFLDDETSAASKETVSFSSLFALESLSAESYSVNGSRYKKNKVSNFSENNSSSGSVFYDDSKEQVFYFTGLSKGAKTKLDYTLNIKQPNLMSSVFMQDYYPSEKIETSITFPSQVEVGFKLFNLKEGEYAFSKVIKGGNTTYTWLRNNVKEVEFESDAPNPRYYMPQIHPYIISSKNKDGSIKKHVGTVDQLHSWYRELIKGYEKNTDEPNDELVRIVDSLTTGITEEEAKVKTIFNWVQRNIKYIAFEYELAGFIPRPAAKVCKRRFGDCKDMASILTEMLGLAKIPAYLTWIGTRSIPYTYEEISTPSVDNHMIATYFNKSGIPIFLDATDRYIPYGQIADHIQGKEAMISLSDTDYKVIKVPEASANFSQQYDSCYLKLDGSTIKGVGYQKLTGHYRNYATYYLSSYDESQKQRYFKATLKKGNNKFNLIDYTLKNLEDYEKPIEIDYQFDLQSFVQSYEDEIYVNMNLNGTIGTRIEEDRELAFDFKFKKKEKYVFILEIPSGYKATYIPENYAGNMKDFDYNITYTLNGSKLRYELNLYRDLMIMDKSYFNNWNQIFKDISSAFTETVVLQKQ